MFAILKALVNTVLALAKVFSIAKIIAYKYNNLSIISNVTNYKILLA